MLLKDLRRKRKSRRVAWTTTDIDEKYWSSNTTDTYSEIPWGRRLRRKRYLETLLNTAFCSNSATVWCCHFSGPPMADRSEKNSSISMWNGVFK